MARFVVSDSSYVFYATKIDRVSKHNCKNELNMEN
jgi:hypothetical protein